MTYAEFARLSARIAAGTRLRARLAFMSQTNPSPAIAARHDRIEAHLAVIYRQRGEAVDDETWGEYMQRWQGRQRGGGFF